MGLIISNPESDESPRTNRSPRERSPRNRMNRSKSDAGFDEYGGRTLAASKLSQSEGFLFSSVSTPDDADEHVADMKRARHRSFSKTRNNFPDFSKDGEKVPQLVLESPALEKKLLLLGTGDGGKSTWLKQCRALYQMFSVNELKSFKETVLSNLLDSVMMLVKAAEDWEYEIHDQKAVFDLKNLMDSVCLYVSVSSSFTADIVDHIKNIIAEKAIKQVLERKKELQFYENGEYWFENIDRICDPDYVPTMQDVVRTKVKTVGMIETEKVVEISEELINTDNVPISLCDVGGQRPYAICVFLTFCSERRKWVHGYKNVSAVLYFVSLPEFTQTCYEDEVTNRLTESVKVFEGIINHQGKAEALNLVNSYLIFTKPDLLVQAIKENNSEVQKLLGEFAQDEGQTQPVKFFEAEKEKDENVEHCRQIVVKKFLSVVKDEQKRAELSQRCFVVNCLQLKDVQYAMTQILKDVCLGKIETAV